MKPHDTSLLREFLDRHGSPAVIIRCPLPRSDSLNCPGSRTADLDCLQSPTDDLYSPPFPTTISDSLPPALDPALDPKLIYFNPSFSAWIRDVNFPENAFKEWAEDSSMWHDIRNQKTANISYAHTIWLSYLIGGKWGVLQSTLHWSQMNHMNIPVQELDEEMKRIKRWRNPSLDALPLATSPLDTSEYTRPRKRCRSYQNEEVSPASSCTLTGENTCFPQQGPSIGSMLAREGRLHDWTRYDIPTGSEYIKFFTSIRLVQDSCWPDERLEFFSSPESLLYNEPSRSAMRFLWSRGPHHAL